MVQAKIEAVKPEAEMNQTRKNNQNMMTAASKGGQALAAMLASG